MVAAGFDLANRQARWAELRIEFDVLGGKRMLGEPDDGAGKLVANIGPFDAVNPKGAGSLWIGK